MEDWKSVKGYEGEYQVSNKGRIFSLKSKKILKPIINKRGYSYVHLSKCGKIRAFRIHRLVAHAFIENTHRKTYVNHLDGNKQNNNAENLEWCTPKENTQHAINVLHVDYSKGLGITHKANERKVIRSDGKVYESIRDAKADMKNAHAHISEVCQGKLKHSCGYGWRYYD